MLRVFCLLILIPVATLMLWLALGGHEPPDGLGAGLSYAQRVTLAREFLHTSDFERLGGAGDSVRGIRPTHRAHLRDQTRAPRAGARP